jgi:chromosomal replication initiator protein
MTQFSVADIKAATALFFDIPVSWMTNRDRHKEAVRPRRVAMYLSRTLPTREISGGRIIPRHSYPRLGHFFGGRDHTTVLHAVRYTKRSLKRDHKVRHQVMEIVAALHRGAVA